MQPGNLGTKKKTAAAAANEAVFAGVSYQHGCFDSLASHKLVRFIMCSRFMEVVGGILYWDYIKFAMLRMLLLLLLLLLPCVVHPPPCPYP